MIMASASTSRNELPSQTTGHCACKRTRYTLKLTDLASDLRLTAYCHCSKCQRLNGAPFIWTTHWAEEAVLWFSSDVDGSQVDGSERLTTKGEARLIPLQQQEGSVAVPDPTFAPTMAVYETMPNRKWKIRCDHCGTPLGSWNQAKRQWSIWPSSLSRDYQNPESPSPEGAIHPAVLTAIAADHHMFYGDWKLMPIQDGLDKFVGYRGQSPQVA